MEIILPLIVLAFFCGIVAGMAVSSRRRPGWSGKPRYIPPAIRSWIIDVSGRSCIYCGRTGGVLDPDGKAWEIDHVIPLSKGGKHALANMALSCRACNRRKLDNLPALPFTKRRLS